MCCGFWRRCLRCHGCVRCTCFCCWPCRIRRWRRRTAAGTSFRLVGLSPGPASPTAISAFTAILAAWRITVFAVQAAGFIGLLLPAGGSAVIVIVLPSARSSGAAAFPTAGVAVPFVSPRSMMLLVLWAPLRPLSATICALPPRIFFAALAATIPAPISRVACIVAVLAAAVPTPFLIFVPIPWILAVLSAAIPSPIPGRPWHAGLPKAKPMARKQTTLSGQQARIFRMAVVDTCEMRLSLLKTNGVTSAHKPYEIYLVQGWLSRLFNCVLSAPMVLSCYR